MTSASRAANCLATASPRPELEPVINTFLPSSVPVIARDQKEGITIEPKNHFALASAMNQMLSNRDWAAGLGENGYKRFNEQFTDLKFQEALTTLFDDLLAIKQ